MSRGMARMTGGIVAPLERGFESHIGWVGPFGVAVALAAAVTWVPQLALLVGLGSLIACVGWVAVERRPRITLGLSPVLVLLSWTKFRTRDVTATLSGQVDAQILVELALHGAAALIALRVLTRAQGRGYRPRGVEWLAIAYVAMAFLSTAWSQNPALTLVRSSLVAVMLLTAIAMVRVLGPGEAMRWMGRSVLVYVVLLWPIATIAPAHLHFVWEGRPGFSWFSMHPGSVATIAATALIIIAGSGGRLLDRRSSGGKVTLLFAWVSLAVLLVLTRSRTHIIGVTAGLMVLALFRSRYRALVPLVGLAAGAALLLLLPPGELALSGLLEAGAASESWVAEYAFRGQSAKAVGSLTGRLVVWKDTLSLMVGEKLLIGFGYEAYRSVLIGRGHWATDPHNATLQSLMNLGLVGAFLIHALILQVFVTALPRYNRSASQRRDVAIVLGLACFVILHGIVSGGFAGHGFPVFLAFLVSVAAGALRQGSDAPNTLSSRPDWTGASEHALESYP